MPALLRALRWILRLVAIVALAFGIWLWTGHGFSTLRIHVMLGFVATAALLMIGVAALFRAVLPLGAIAILWALALPIVGFGQMNWLVGPHHWTVEVVHLVIGLGSIGLGEVTAARSLRAER